VTGKSTPEHHHEATRHAPAKTAARAPSEAERASAKRVSLSEKDATSTAGIMLALPDPSELAPGALVIVPAQIGGGRSFTKSVLAVFGRNKTVPTALRCTALVARGYVHVGAADDLAFGYVPASEK